MTIISALTGGLMGVGAQVYSNAMKKVPLSRQPWMHAFMFFSGCYVGQKYPKAELALLESINAKREARGQPPMVGTSGWVHYQIADAP